MIPTFEVRALAVAAGGIVQFRKRSCSSGDLLCTSAKTDKAPLAWPAIGLMVMASGGNAAA